MVKGKAAGSTKPPRVKKPTSEKAPPKTPKTKGDVPGAIDANADGPGEGPGKGHNRPTRTTPTGEQELFLQHRVSWNNWRAKVKAVEALGIDVKAALKSDGFKVIHMQIADNLLNVKGEAKVTAEVKDRLQVARWIGHAMGNQLDMFEQPDRTPSADKAYENGRIASMQNQPRKPPHDPSTEQYRTWTDGYNDHQEELLARLGKAPRTAEERDTTEAAMNKPAEEPAAEQPAADPIEEIIETAGERIPRSEFHRRLRENPDKYAS